MKEKFGKERRKERRKEMSWGKKEGIKREEGKTLKGKTLGRSWCKYGSLERKVGRKEERK